MRVIKGITVAMKWGWICLPRTLVLLLLAGCATDLGERLQSGQVLAWQGLQGRWVGTVIPSDAACGPATQGLMTIGENGFGFDPFQSTTVIDGQVDKNRHLAGALERQGPQHQSLSITFEGQASEADTINGTLQSGRCHWMVVLHRG